MKNSPLISYTKLSPNHSGPRKYDVERITPHVYEGQVTVEQMGDWFGKATAKVSANYGIDLNGRVGLFVDESMRAWTSSNADNDERAITIECASDMSSPYAVRDVVWQSLIALCVDICRRYGKTKLLWLENKNTALAYKPAKDEMVLTVHQWFIDTSCPGKWMMSRMGTLAQQVTKQLEENTPIEEPKNEEPKKEEPKEEPSIPVITTGLQASQLKGLSNGEVIRAVAPYFTEDQKKSEILASVSLAQFLLESSYGQSNLCQSANNGFGMKTYLSGNTWPNSAWDGETKYTMQTEEYKDDDTPYTISASFRKYPNLEASIADHSAYLLGATTWENNVEKLRYEGLNKCKTYRDAFQVIKDGGYATSPDYVDWLCKVVEMWNLTQYDIPVVHETPTDITLQISITKAIEALNNAAAALTDLQQALNKNTLD